MDNISLLFQAPPLALQLLIDGILIGAIFALAAYGMALVWGVMNIINIVQGEFVILGGYLMLTLTNLGVPIILGIPLSALFMFILGFAIYKIVIFRIVDRDIFTSLLATFGLQILLQQLMNEIFGADVQALESGLGSFFFFDGLVAISQVKLLAFAITCVIAVLIVAFLKSSRMGQAIRATAQNARAARILGIDTDHVYAVTYGLNAAMCGAAGTLVVMALTIHPYQGLVYTVRSFTIVIVAGLGNLGAVVASAFGLGAAEQFAGFIIGAEYQLAFVYLLLVAILMYRALKLRRERKVLS